MARLNARLYTAQHGHCYSCTMQWPSEARITQMLRDGAGLSALISLRASVAASSGMFPFAT